MRMVWNTCSCGILSYYSGYVYGRTAGTVRFWLSRFQRYADKREENYYGITGKKGTCIRFRKKRNRSIWPLAKVGAFPVIYDGNAETDKDAVVHKTDGTYPVTVYAGELPKEVQDSLDLVVLSPGVPTDLPLVKSFLWAGASGMGRGGTGIQSRWRWSACHHRNKRKNYYNSTSWKNYAGCTWVCFCSRQYRNPIYFQSAGDEAKLCNCCRNQQFSAGNDWWVCTKGICNPEYYREFILWKAMHFTYGYKVIFKHVFSPFSDLIHTSG